MNDEKKGTWGGARKGSGSKPLPDNLKKKKIFFYISPELLKELEILPGKNRTDKIMYAIQKTLKDYIRK